MEINLNSTNLNNISNQTFGSSSKIEDLKSAYIEYGKEISKTDFANSFTRYQMQYCMLKDINRLAIEQGDVSQNDFIKEQFKLICEKMKQFGVKPKAL